MANKITAAGKMTPAQFSSAASETETLARSVYLKLHALKNEMDSWESHDGVADFNERQQKIYSLIMKAVDEANKTISTTHQMRNEVKNYVSSSLKAEGNTTMAEMNLVVDFSKLRDSSRSPSGFSGDYLVDKKWYTADGAGDETFFDSLYETVQEAANKLFNSKFTLDQIVDLKGFDIDPGVKYIITMNGGELTAKEEKKVKKEKKVKAALCELVAAGIEVKDGKVRRSDIEAYLTHAISSTVRTTFEGIREAIQEEMDSNTLQIAGYLDHLKSSPSLDPDKRNKVFQLAMKLYIRNDELKKQLEK